MKEFSLETINYNEAREKAMLFWAYAETPIFEMRIGKKRDAGIWYLFYRTIANQAIINN